MYYVHKKARCGPEIETFRTKTLHFFRVIRLKLAPCPPPPPPPPRGHAYAPMNKNKKGIRKFSARFLAFSNKISTVQKIVLSSSRGQGNFHGLDLRGQGQGHENVSSRTPPLTNSSVKPSSWSEVLLLSKSFKNLSN